MASRKKKVSDFAECSICGDRVNPSDAEMMYHMANVHPLHLLQHPRVAGALYDLAYHAGAALANLFKVKV